jgi:hypothetical protein
MYSQKQILVEPKPVEEDACVQINQHARRRLIGGGSVVWTWMDGVENALSQKKNIVVFLCFG